MHLGRGGVPGGDHGLQRDQQTGQRLQHPGQGALGHGQSLSGQHLDDPVHRQTQHELQIEQPRAERGREPALGNRVRRRRRGHRPRPRTGTRPPVPHPPVHDPGQVHLPVDLLAAFGPQRSELHTAVRADPLIGRHIMDLLPGVQMRVVPPTVPLAARPLPPLRPLTLVIGVAVTAGAIANVTGLPCWSSGPPRPPAPADAFSDERPNSIRDNTATCSTSSSTRASARSARCSARSARSRQDVTSVTSTTSGSGPTQRSKHVRAGHISNPASRASRTHSQRLHARTEYLRSGKPLPCICSGVSPIARKPWEELACPMPSRVSHNPP